MNFIKSLTNFSFINHKTLKFVSYRCYSKPSVPAAAKKKKLGKLGPVAEKITIPVETDATKLVNYVCGSNIMKTGQDIKIKQDSEYPEWLWAIHTGAAPTLDQLDPETKQYWRKLRKTALQRNNKLSKLKKF